VVDAVCRAFNLFASANNALAIPLESPDEAIVADTAGCILGMSSTIARASGVTTRAGFRADFMNFVLPGWRHAVQVECV
jgi:hypothetical protein